MKQKIKIKLQSGEITTILAIGSMVFILAASLVSNLISKKPQTTVTKAACPTSCSTGSLYSGNSLKEKCADICSTHGGYISNSQCVDTATTTRYCCCKSGSGGGGGGTTPTTTSTSGACPKADTKYGGKAAYDFTGFNTCRCINCKTFNPGTGSQYCGVDNSKDYDPVKYCCNSSNPAYDPTKMFSACKAAQSQPSATPTPTLTPAAGTGICLYYNACSNICKIVDFPGKIYYKKIGNVTYLYVKNDKCNTQSTTYAVDPKRDEKLQVACGCPTTTANPSLSPTSNVITNAPTVSPPRPDNGTCKGREYIIHYEDCQLLNDAGQQSCGSGVSVDGVTGAGCRIYRICPDPITVNLPPNPNADCQYDCYKNNKKYNCIGGGDPNTGYDVVRIVNNTANSLEIKKVIVTKKRTIGANLAHPISGKTLPAGNTWVIDLNAENFTCDAISLNSMQVDVYDQSDRLIGSGSDGCGGGVKIMIIIK